MNIIALLPMKAHSERVINKNLKPFGVKPLYHAIVNTLLNSKYIEKIIINTDSEKIANDALSNFIRVEIINRPDELRGDFVPMNDIIAYDLSQTDGAHFLQTHSTNPLITTETIDRAIETYFRVNGEYDSLFSVTKLQTRLYWKNGEPVNHDPHELIRTQDLPPVFEENSNLYIFSRSSFENARNHRIGQKPYMFEMDKIEAIDIDEPEDFELAEIIFLHGRK